MAPKIFDKICNVCGDKASGYHFDAITCESCKSFFRRNAVKYQRVRCFLGGNCKIDVFNRTFCKRCRLKKCFDSGMKTEYILTEDQKRIRKSLIDENRKRKQLSSMSETNDQADSGVDSGDSAGESNGDDIIALDFIIESEGYGDSCERISNESNTNDEFEMSLIAIERSITDPKYVFNESEGNRLTELLNAMQFMSNPSATKGEAINDFWEAIRILYLKLDVDIRKLVKTSKSLSGFLAIDESDQFVLLKSAAIEFVIMRLILQFDFQEEYWSVAMQNSQNSNLIKLDLLNNDNRPQNTYPDHKHFLQCIGPEWDSDPVILDLLSVIVLFNPIDPRLQSKEAVKLQQQIYLYLLKRYLQIKYRSEEESESKFSRLIKSLSYLQELNQKIRFNCKTLDLPDIPLIKEVCGP